MLDYNKFIEWVLIKEPTLKVDELIEPPISVYSNQLLTLAFEQAYYRCVGIKRYLNNYNFIDCVYNYALHIAIMDASFNVTVDEDGNIIDEPTEALQKLFIRYVDNSGVNGITTSASSGGSSASSTLPKSITDGDLETSYLMTTPYGQQVEMYFEQLGGVCII